MTAPAKRGPGRPRKNAVQPEAPRTAVEPSVAPSASEPAKSCDCEAKLRELEGRLKFLEIRIL